MELEPLGHFMRSGGHIRSRDIFLGTGVRACQFFFRFRIHAGDAKPESEPQHFARHRNRSRQDILLSAGAPASADVSQDFIAGVEPTLLKIIDLLITR